MSIRKYIAYLKTIETGSITHAAAQLGYTQSAISRMIADLEDSWGVKLLTRNRSGIEISSEGLTLLPKLQAICKDYEDLNYAISELHGLSSGSIRLGAFSSISSGRLPQIIKSFHELYPHIDFQLVNGEYNQIATWLRKGLVDCGFVSLPAPNDLEASFLLQDNLVVILPENHPLADAPVYPVERLSSEDFINLKEEQDYEITKFLDHLQQKPNIRYEVSDDYAILSMVECGLGASAWSMSLCSTPTATACGPNTSTSPRCGTSASRSRRTWPPPPSPGCLWPTPSSGLRSISPQKSPDGDFCNFRTEFSPFTPIVWYNHTTTLHKKKGKISKIFPECVVLFYALLFNFPWILKERPEVFSLLSFYFEQKYLCFAIFLSDFFLISCFSGGFYASAPKYLLKIQRARTKHFAWSVLVFCIRFQLIRFLPTLFPGIQP